MRFYERKRQDLGLSGRRLLLLASTVTLVTLAPLLPATAASAEPATPTPSRTAASPSASPAPAAPKLAAPKSAAPRPTVPKATPPKNWPNRSVPKPKTPKPRPAATKPPAADCGGALAFGAIVNCAIAGPARHTFTVAVSAPADDLIVQFRDEGDPLGGTITDAQGGRVCFLQLASTGDCKVDSAGTYTITVESSWTTGSGTYWLSVNSLRQPTTCRTLTGDFFAMGSPGLDGHLLAGSAGDCYQFEQPAGAVLRLYEITGDDHSDVQGEITNAAGSASASCDTAATAH